MLRAEVPMASYHIRKYQEGDHQRVLELFCRGMEEHIPATFRHALTLPRFRLLLLGAPLAIVLVSGSWLLATASIFSLLLILWLLARQPWKKYVAVHLHTDMADITKSFLSSPDSCFWVAESGGQVVGTVCALPVEEPPLGRKQLQLFRLSVSSQYRGRGIAKALVRTVLQFARDRGFGEVVLDASVMQHGAVAVYQGMGFRNTGESSYSIIAKLLAIYVIHFTYPLPSAQECGL